MNNLLLTIRKSDYELLSSHLRLSTNLSEFNKNKLTEELKSANILDDADLPADAIALYTSVRIKDVATGQEFSFQLVQPAEADMKKGKLSAFAPIGIALLGYRAGDKVEWEMPNGVKVFEILEVGQSG